MPVQLPHIPVKTTGTAYRKRIVRGNERDVLVHIALVDGAEVGDFTTPEMAVMEADWAAYYQVFPGQELRADVPLDQEARGRAIKLFKVFFRDETMRKSGETAIEAYLSSETAHEKWSILADGTLAITPTPKRKRKGDPAPEQAEVPAEPYLITHQQLAEREAVSSEPRAANWQVRETCTCPDAAARVWRHSGMCKHVALRVMLVVAQHGLPFLQAVIAALRGTPAASPTGPAPISPEITPAPPTAISEAADIARCEPAPAALVPALYCDLPARHLASAVLFIRTVGQGRGATLFLLDGLLALSVNEGESTVNLSGLAGQGSGERPLSGTDVEALWQRAQTLSKALKDQPVRLAVDETVQLEPVAPVVAEAGLPMAA
jgi:hypothetical protein